ncbi:putative transposase [Paenochrobactrum gallinarii]|uniref:Putative transposase n=1 Tax=Paenochrobactrum gallinarii TaxID=643673 RepID=A0A841M4J7_9HYPH|nr:putative transposase [Paenochrobactrum gallinarii]
MDWATRKVLSWWLSNTMDASFCDEALNEAIFKYGKPEIMNSVQGPSLLEGTGSTFWRSQDQNINGWSRALSRQYFHRKIMAIPLARSRHLNELLDDFQAKRVIKDWIGFYNTERPRSAFEKQTPEMHTLAQYTSTKRHKI